ncbi:autotransporter outer membrane beta-barrel domain-containing protein [Mesorhizobium sp. VK25A]|uniref:Autotransporter outer membrane beta-barrel domain-containing protein n=1 Tax=Mesorhizobium vachelliae TaxID=3072309 RepID=A0ABU4ZZG8_9HYPH|nr:MULTISPECIES: autotransporter outer membrane beta-barrel domain-containing protein [unclassified Mesorhizobium]MDX8530825.1 autotransporter outer membrane beta-barrel domain-containing protein [Mesorhizobium sp. VK25D]MDX8543424.1 autotransporter outer membrane beta-barrel domain-containing protein [Mesorhizobium sp. VK25A]
MGNYAPGHYPVGDYDGNPPAIVGGQNDDHVGQTTVGNGSGNTLGGDYGTIQNGVPNWTQQTLQQIGADGRIINGAVLPDGVLSTGQQNQTVTFFDETDQESVTVNVYNSSNFTVAPDSRTFTIWDDVNDQEAYLDPRLATVSNGSSLSVTVGTPGGDATAAGNILNMPMKASPNTGTNIISAYEVNDTSTLSYDTSTRFDLGEYATPGKETNTATVAGVNFNKGVVIPGGATWINPATNAEEAIPAGVVTDVASFQNYNNYLVGLIQKGQFVVPEGMALEQAYKNQLASAYSNNNVEVEYRQATLPKYVQDMPLGDRTLIHGTDTAGITIKAGETLEDVTSGDAHSIVNLEDSATLENNGTLSSSYSAHAIVGHDNADIHNTASGVISNFIPGADGKVDPSLAGPYSRGVVLDGSANFTNDGIVNVAASTNLPYWLSAPENNPDSARQDEDAGLWNAGVVLSGNSTATNTTNGVINVGINDAGGNISLVDGVFLQGTLSFTNEGNINIGKTAQFDKADAQSDTSNNSAIINGMRALGDAKVENAAGATITIGANTARATAMYAGSGTAGTEAAGTGALELINNGTIIINGNRSGSPNINYGIAAENVEGTIVHNGDIELNGVNARGVYIYGTRVDTHADVTADSTILVGGGFNAGTNTRNYGVWVQGSHATANVDGVVNLDGVGGIGVHAREGAVIALGDTAEVNFVTGSDQIGYFIHGKGSAINNVAHDLDVSTDDSTLFRIEDGASYNGEAATTALTLTASGAGSTIVQVTGNDTHASTGSSILNLTGDGAVAIKSEGGATVTVDAETQMGLNGDNTIGGIVDGRKLDLAGKPIDSGRPSQLDNHAELTSANTGVTGLIARHGGNLTNDAAISFTGTNSTGIIAEIGGKANNSGAIDIADGTGILVRKTGQATNSNTVDIASGQGVIVQDSGIFDNKSGGDITVQNGTGILVENTDGTQSTSKVTNQADIVVNDGIAGIHVRNGAALDGGGLSGTITVNGTAHGVLIGQNASGLLLGGTEITTNGTGNGIENEAELENVELQGTTINVNSSGAGIRTGTSFTTASTATINVNGAGSTGFLFQLADGSSTDKDLLLTDKYDINLAASSSNARGIDTNTSGNVAVGATLNDLGTGNTAVHITNAAQANISSNITVNTDSGSGGTGIYVENAERAIVGGTVQVGAQGGSALVVEHVDTDASNLGSLISASAAPVVDLSPSTGTAFNNYGTIEAKAYNATAVLGSAGADTIKLGQVGDFSSAVTGVVDAGAGTDTVEWSAGTLVGSIDMGAGDNEQLTVVGRDLSTVYHLDGGAGAGDTLNFSNIQYYGGSFAADDAFQNRVQGINLGQDWETINFTDNTDFTLTGDLLYGDTLNLDDTSVIHAGNNVNPRLGLAGSIFDNRGILDLTNGAYSLTDTATVSGNYVGTEGSALVLNTHLAFDNSPTDKLIINGASSGATSIKVNVDPGSPGALTYNGIKVVQVDDDANSNAVFTLQGDYEFEGDPAVVGGAFSYRLYKNGITTPTDGDWYLRSTLTNPDANPPPGGPAVDPPGPLYQPGVPLYEDYAQSLLGFNSLPTLQQRAGNRYWNQPPQTIFCKDPEQNYQCVVTPEQSGYYKDGNIITGQNGVWGRIEASHGSFEPSNSTSGTDYDQDIWKLQAGIDGLLTETDSGLLVGGVSVHYGTTSTDVSSFYGDGKIDTQGYGLGASLTWYGANGFYVDGQGQMTWYDSELKSDPAGTVADGAGGFGYALSIEAGKRFQLNPSWTVIPQAQLIYSSVSLDSFDDRFGAHVTPGDAESLRGRLGLAIEHQLDWTSDSGEKRHASIYGIGNLYYEFADRKSSANVAGTKFSSQAADDLWGEIGLGATVNLTDKLDLHGEARYATALKNAGDNNTVAGNVGLRFNW